MTPGGQDDNNEKASKSVADAGRRTYRVASRLLEQFQEIVYFVSPRAHDLWHELKWLYPDHAGKKITEIPVDEVPKGFRYLDRAVYNRFNRDLARFATRFHPATLEELLAAKIEKLDTGEKRLTLKEAGVKQK